MTMWFYGVGVGLCMVWRWMDWIKRQQAGTPMMKFWRARLPTNVSSAVIAFLLMGAYTEGYMHQAVMATGWVPDEYDQPLYTKWWAAMIAGFALCYGARRIVGYLSDKFGVKNEEEG